jgi:hypothetical protein
MQSWLVRRRARIDQTDAEAEALIRDFTDEAYSEARRREQEASSDETAKNWRRVALAVALKMARRTGIDPSTRIAMNALFVPDREPTVARLPRMKPWPDKWTTELLLDEAAAVPDPTCPRGRSRTDIFETSTAADTSAAVDTAANTVWPPQTIGLRISADCGQHAGDSMQESITSPAANGAEISLPGFGNCKVEETPEREGRNPTSGE